ncbi:MAG: GNAT family N-acetyltransferase [Candidatus Eremiobacteraeota bacterium]|nr:GNAT family N-acetyltransferase [Candidatus Eremiobacteraeota bacterium]MBC5804582.1 GNAT family N-acetyltransferase [Candidatus Eremiobacteraeota bacterium]MBC5822794.1 GNAT family N-acetyltransferase [Candidatus Eremiobacteraeota bacterium]
MHYHWLRAWQRREGIGIFGPIGIAPRAQRAGIGSVLLHAALFSLRERGYREALIPMVGEPGLIAFYERHAGARVVETVDLGRGGRRYRATVLASGNGSNFQAVIDGALSGRLSLEVAALVTNRTSAFALQRAARAGIAANAIVWDRSNESRETYDDRVLAAVAATEPDLVLLLGWMHVLPASFIARFAHILNLHPAYLPVDPAEDITTMPDGTLLPAFRGARALDDALAAGSPWAGATVHRVGIAVDRGTVLARAPLRLEPDEPRDALNERLHALERRVVATGIRRWSWEQP